MFNLCGEYPSGKLGEVSAQRISGKNQQFSSSGLNYTGIFVYPFLSPHNTEVSGESPFPTQLQAPPEI